MREYILQQHLYANQYNGLQGMLNGINLQPLSNEQLMALDAADPRTKRGSKLERDKNNARS